MQRQFATFKQGQRTGKGPTHETLVELYGTLVFDTAAPMLEELAKAGITLESDSYEGIKDLTSKDFADRVGALKQQIREQVPQEHMGPFDGWVKHIAHAEFGAGSDFGQLHGDQELNLLCLVLRNQAQRVADIRAFEKVLGKDGIPTTKSAVRPLLAEFMGRVSALQAESEQKKKDGAPKQTDPVFNPEGKLVFAKYLAAKTSYEAEVRSGEGKFKYLRNVGKRLGEWVADDKSDNRPPKTRRDQMLDEIAKLQDRIKGLQGEEAAAVKDTQYGVATEKKAERQQAEQGVRNIETELAKLEPEGANDNGARSTTPEPAPMGTGPRVEGDPVAAKATAGNIAGKIEAKLAEMTRLRELINSDDEVGNNKEREAGEKSKSARAEGVDDSTAETLLREARTLRETVTTLRATNTTRLEQYNKLEANVADLRKQAAKPTTAPGGGKKGKKKDAPVVAPEAPAAAANNNGNTITTLAELVAALKASELDEPGQRAIRVLAIKDLTGAIAMFATATKPVDKVTPPEPSELEVFVADVTASALSDEEKVQVRDLAADDLPGAREIYEALIA